MIFKLLKIIDNERMMVDARSVAALRKSLGPHRTREILEEVVFHLTDRLGLLNRALEAGDAPQARALAGRMAAMSEQVGLLGFARVARDLGACLDRRDPVASAAVAARLSRLSDCAVIRLIDYADRSAL